MSEPNSNSTSTTKIPLPVVDPDQLPREKNWNYPEIAGIVGNLYLEAHRRASIMEEQSRAIIDEYQRKIGEIQHVHAQVVEENNKLRRELERRNEQQQRANSVPNNVG